MKNLTAKDIMSTEVIWVHEDLPIFDVADLFLKENITGVPVVDDENAMTGVISLRDIVQNGLQTDRSEIVESDSQFYSMWLEENVTEADIDHFKDEVNRPITVKDVMTPLVFSTNEDTPIQELADTMIRGRIHRLMVTDENDRLSGIVTTLDLLKIIRDAA